MGTTLHGSIVDGRQAQAALHGQVTKENVLGNRHIRHDRDLLRQQSDSRGNSQAWLRQARLAAVDQD